MWISWRSHLRAWRGRLYSGSGPGMEVHASGFLRRRELVLDSALKSDPEELSRILAHEVFHFVWLRLNNSARLAWERVLQAEIAARARGELGWSAESRKHKLNASDAALRTRRWREYACESFCDTAAWLYSGVPEHEEFTLKNRFQSARKAVFGQFQTLRGGVFRI